MSESDKGLHPRPELVKWYFMRPYGARTILWVDCRERIMARCLLGELLFGRWQALAVGRRGGGEDDADGDEGWRGSLALAAKASRKGLRIRGSEVPNRGREERGKRKREEVFVNDVQMCYGAGPAEMGNKGEFVCLSLKG